MNNMLGNKPKSLAIKKWYYGLDDINRKYPNVTSASYSGKTWTAKIWIDPDKDNIVHYQYTRTVGAKKGEVFAKGYFPV